MEPHETHRRSPRSAAPRRKATGQDRGAARCDQAHASIGPVILPSTNCRLYYRLVNKPVFGESAAIERSTSVKKTTQARCRLLVHELQVRAQVSGKG